MLGSGMADGLKMRTGVISATNTQPHLSLVQWQVTSRQVAVIWLVLRTLVGRLQCGQGMRLITPLMDHARTD